MPREGKGQRTNKGKILYEKHREEETGESRKKNN